jgi:hypothetical protein
VAAVVLLARLGEQAASVAVVMVVKHQQRQQVRMD